MCFFFQGILKNKQQQNDQPQDVAKEEETETKQDGGQEEKSSHPASPQYQGQPLRYPSLPSDPNLPPTSQESGIPHQHGPFAPGLPTMPPSLPPGHHLVQQLDPNLPPQVHIAPQPLHLDGPRIEGAPPAQIVVEHPTSGAAPIHITHHRLPGPAQIHIDPHQAGGGPRQVIMEHPPPQAIHLEPPGPQLQPEHIHPEHLHPHMAPQAAQTQEMYEFEAGAQQVPPASPQYQNFEHVPVSQPPPPPNEQLVPGGGTVMISTAQPFPTQFSVAMSSAAPPPSVTYTLPASAQPFPIQAQPIQRFADPHQLAGPPPPSASYSIGLPPPTSTHHFQQHFANVQPAQNPHLPPQIVQPHGPPPPTTPVNSQFQPTPQGMSYWVSQA